MLFIACKSPALTSSRTPMKDIQLKELASENLIEVYSLESKVIRPVALMCHYGFNVDISKVKELKAKKEQE